jgi:hypothetical protein
MIYRSDLIIETVVDYVLLSIKLCGRGRQEDATWATSSKFSRITNGFLGKSASVFEMFGNVSPECTPTKPNSWSLYSGYDKFKL